MIFDQTCIYTFLGEGKELIRFWWPWPYFQGYRGTLKCPKYGFRAISSELVDEFWLDLLRNIVGRRKRLDKILVTLTLFSRSQLHFEMSKVWFPCVIFWTIGRILTTHLENRRLDFGDLDLNFKVTPALWNDQNMVSVLIFWTSWWILIKVA